MMTQKKLIFFISSAIFMCLFLLGNISLVSAAWPNSTPPVPLPDWVVAVIVIASVGGLATVILVWYFLGRKGKRDAKEQVLAATK